MIVRAYYKTYDFPATITNTSNNFGAYQFPEKFIPLCITRLIDGKNIRLHGKGDHIRDWLFVEDHCRAIEQVLRRGKLGEVYLVAGRAQLSILEVAQRICQIFGVGDERIEFVPDRPSNDKAYKLDWTKINRELGWEPLFSFDEWLVQTVEWYKNNEAWWRPLVKQSFAWGSTGHKEEVSTPTQPASVPVSMPYNSTLGSVNAQQPSYGKAGEAIVQSQQVQPITFLENSNITAPVTGFSPLAQKPKKVLIFGNGQLSMHFQQYYQNHGAEVVVAALPNVDVLNYAQVANAISEVQPDLVFNCTGMTNLDWVEANQDEAAAVNIGGAENIARACAEKNVYMVHFSTGYVHASNGITDERSELDQPNPINFYAYTKAKADESLMQMTKQGLRVLIIRTNMLLSAVPHPKNVLAKMTIYNKFHDMHSSMTVIEDLVVATDKLIQSQKTGLYNVVNPGLTSPLKIANLLKEIINPEMQIEKLSKEDVEKMYTIRRPDSVLSSTKLNREGVMLPEINQRLRGIITVLRDNLRSESAQQIMSFTAQEDQKKKELKQTQVINHLFNKNS